MYKRFKNMLPPVVSGLLVLLTACSTQHNTAQSRWWHAFNTRYNVYYNASQAYIDGCLEKENGNQDNYTDLLPLYYIGNKGSLQLGSGQFDKAIEKCRKAIQLHSIKRHPVWNKQRRKTARDTEWLNRREYNPFLWKAWLLMGRSQFQKGDLEEAVSTFSHMSRLYATQPAIHQKAQAWLAKCHVELGERYNADDVLRNMQRDSILWQAQKEWDYTLTDYFLHIKDYARAAAHLRRVIAREQRHRQKAREWFLMGQLQSRLNRPQEAYKAYARVIALNPPYELEFNARIAMTEVMADGQQRQTIAKLHRMAASDKNRDYLEQVFYAIGNIHLGQKDTLRAIQAYEEGGRKAQKNSWSKGVLLQRLSDLYWSRQRFGDARRCYTEAIGMLDKSRQGYQQMTERSVILDELVPFTDQIALQDSLLLLATLPEDQRNEAIDRTIAALKRKEKAERAAAEGTETVSAAGGNAAANRPTGDRRTNQPTFPQAQDKQNTWYFYNPMAVNAGKETFRRIWGNRQNTDDWQRKNKTVVGSTDLTDASTPAANDTLAAPTAPEKPKAEDTRAESDPHKREYYLAQIPLTEAQQAESHRLLADALFHSGVIFKDKLDEFTLSRQALERLEREFPQFEQMDETCYHLYLLHARMGQMALADSYIERLKQHFKDSKWTAVLTDPYFKENAVMGQQLEDSLYGATYDAFKAGQYATVNANRAVSDKRFPMGANRDKFLFIGGLSRLNDGDTHACLADMQQLVADHPTSRLSELAGMIVNGVKAGRTPHGGPLHMDQLWQRRAAVMSDSDSIASVQLSADTQGEYLYILVYSPDSLNENQLLFEMARYNFTNYLVRNFELGIVPLEGGHRMEVGGFLNYEEALLYARQLAQQQPLKGLVAKAHSLIISRANLELIGRQFSYADYQAFYDEHFAPIKLTRNDLLNQPAELIYKDGKPLPEAPQTDTKAVKAKSKQKTVDLNDEYYDLEGF